MVLANAHGLGIMNGEIVHLDRHLRDASPSPLSHNKDGPSGLDVVVRRPDGCLQPCKIVLDFLGGDGSGLRPGDLYRRGTGIPTKIRNRMLVADWGWCGTAHKVQGSEWDQVIVHVPRALAAKEDRRRWLYTAMTRARRRLTIVYEPGLRRMFSASPSDGTRASRGATRARPPTNGAGC